MKSILLLITIFFFCNHLPAQNRPFPQHTVYTTGYIQPNNFSQTDLDNHVTILYDQWKTAYLNNNCGANEYFVEFASNQNVSEGLGYGMIITALMAGYDVGAQGFFDGLYNFYKSHPSNINVNLMAWKQDNCNSVSGVNSATDGDIDIAFGLLLAHEQWGSNGVINYLQESQNMIAAILQDDINPNTWSVKLGDWATSGSPNFYYATRSSDFITDHFRSFEYATGDMNWSNVINTCYNMIDSMQGNYSQITGLMPDFILNVHTNPNPANPSFLEGQYDGDYYYNSCRFPWRIGTDYLLFGEPRAKAATDKITNWLKSSTSNNVANLSNGYLLNGTKIFTWSDPAFVGAFAVAAMVDATHQAWLNALYNAMHNHSFANGGYYENSLKLLYTLVISGNYWSPACTPTTDATLVGYFHNWDDQAAPYIELDQVDSRYHYIDVAFALPAQGSTYDMEFAPLETDSATFATQIQSLQAQGKKVIISIGGATAVIEMTTAAQKDIFVNSMLNIINAYNFDGIDIDLEGSSVNITGGTIAAPIDDKIIYLITAIQDIMASYYAQHGKRLCLTMAPETAFVQGGQSAFGGIWGAYLPVIHALRDSIDILHVQLYNSGTMFGINGQIYSQGTADFIVSQTEALLQGFSTAGGFFNPLNPEQVAIGLPACPNAAGGGYTAPSVVADAIEYLRGNGSQPGTYTLVENYPNLRGMMTWSVNWDALSTCDPAYAYADNFETIFGNPAPLSAEFTATPISGDAPLIVSFDASASTGSGVLSYSWDFGDSNTGTGSMLQHTFNTPGIFTVTLTISNNTNQTATTTETIVVTDPNAPSVNIIAPNSNEIFVQPIGNLTLTAEATDSDGTIATVVFEVGGNLLSATNIGGNIYETTWTVPANAFGPYSVLVTATDNDGKTATDNLSIQLNPASNISITFNVTNDWGTGFCADITITNNGTQAVDGWTFNFDLDADIYTFWNVNWSNDGNNSYTASDVGWNADIAIGASETVGFCANYSGDLTAPTNVLFNNEPVTLVANGFVVNCPNTLNLNAAPIAAGTHEATLDLTAMGLVEDATEVILKASNSVELLPVFEVKLGGILEVIMSGCGGN